MPDLSNTVIVTLSVLGDAASSTGTHYVHLENPTDPRAVGEAMAAAFSAAYLEASKNFAPEMVRIWRDQNARDQGLSDSGPASS